MALILSSESSVYCPKRHNSDFFYFLEFSPEGDELGMQSCSGLPTYLCIAEGPKIPILSPLTFLSAVPPMRQLDLSVALDGLSPCVPKTFLFPSLSISHTQIFAFSFSFSLLSLSLWLSFSLSLSLRTDSWNAFLFVCFSFSQSFPLSRVFLSQSSSCFLTPFSLTVGLQQKRISIT